MTLWRRLFGRGRLDLELDAELRDHLERQIADYRREGLSEAEARRKAAAQFGGLDQAKENCRDQRGTRWLEDLVTDVRYGVRMLAHSRTFTAVAVLSLALGIGANTAIFTLVNSMLLRTLPVADPERLVQLDGDSIDQPDLGADPEPSAAAVRRRNSLVGAAVRSLKRRTGIAGRRAVGQRRVLRGARCPGDSWPDLRARGRPPRRRHRVHSGGHQLRLLAAEVRRRRRRHRALHDAQPRAVHDHRRDAARLHGPDCRPRVRRRGAASNRRRPRYQRRRAAARAAARCGGSTSRRGSGRGRPPSRQQQRCAPCSRRFARRLSRTTGRPSS